MIYPCGHNIAIHDIETKEQQFIAGTDSAASQGMTAMALSPNRKYVAVAEHTPDKALVTVYDVHTCRKRKVLIVPGAGQKFIHIGFSADNKFLLTQTDGPEWLVTTWAWEKAKVLASVRSSNMNGHVVSQADFCPTDAGTICVTGQGLIKFLMLNNGQFRLQPVSMKKDPPHFTCHAWLDGDRVVAGSTRGELWLFENFEFRTLVFRPEQDLESFVPNAILATSKGFVVVGNQARVSLFERSEDPREYYRHTKTLSIFHEEEHGITSLALSPLEDLLLCTLSNHQIYSLNMSHIDILKEDVMNFELFHASFHGPGNIKSSPSSSNDTTTRAILGGITGLDICLRKPLIATSGLDCSVRVWNYVDKTLELMKVFENFEAYSVSFHPSGLHLLVGFRDKLRFLNLLMDDIRCVKAFPIKSCEHVKFSHGGQYFAATNNNMIHVYHTYSYELLVALRGHTNKVTSLDWHANDQKLVSSSADGSIVTWVIKTGQKCGDGYTSTRSTYLDARVTPDGSSILVTTTSQKIMQLDVETGMVMKEVGTSGGGFGKMVLSASQKYLFTGSSSSGAPGTLRIYNYPLLSSTSSTKSSSEDPGVLVAGTDYLDVYIHDGPITNICLSYDQHYLFTTSTDGSISIFETKDLFRGPAMLIGSQSTPSSSFLTSKQGSMASSSSSGQSNATRESLPFAEEILVTESELREQNALMTDLKVQVEELVSHNQYQLRLKDMNYREKIGEVSNKFNAELDQGRRRYEEMKDDKRDMELEYEDKLRDLSEKHGHEITDLKQNYQYKVYLEKERCEKLKLQVSEARATYEEKNQDLVESHTRFLAEMTTDYDHKVQQEKQTKARLLREKQALRQRFEDQRVKIEEDADLEVDEVKSKFTVKLASEREATLRLKGENAIMKKKYGSLQKDIEGRKEEIRSLQDKEKELRETIAGLQKDIHGHQKEIHEREETIQDKEQRIYDLKKKNQELEKFKFVLDYKIKELKRQIEPRENEISDMRQQIEEMDQELEQYHRSNAALDLMIGELKLKMEGMQKELDHQKILLANGQHAQQQLQHDLYECVQVLGDAKKLKVCLVKMYKHYAVELSTTATAKTTKKGKHSAPTTSTSAEQEAQHRQREYLEKSVESLKRKIAKDLTAHQSEHHKLMRENAVLTKECNQLRRELHAVETEERELEMQEQLVSEESVGKKHQQTLRRMGEKQQRKIQDLETQLRYLQNAYGNRPMKVATPSQSNNQEAIDDLLPPIVKSTPIRRSQVEN